MKWEHERKLFGGPQWPDGVDYGRVRQDLMNSFIQHFGDVSGSVITTHNQSGGQNAHVIINTNQESRAPQPILVPEIEILMTGADNVGKIDFYDFRIRLRNDGEVTAREFRLEVEVPLAYANPTNSSVAIVQHHTRAEVKLYRRTQDKLRDFILYPGETSDNVLLLDFQLDHGQYADVEATIKVIVYSGDTNPTVVEFPIRDFRNRDRLNQLRLSH
jgi:hypothetical protein